jgi:hypothetical protein
LTIRGVQKGIVLRKPVEIQTVFIDANKKTPAIAGVLCMQ